MPEDEAAAQDVEHDEDETSEASEAMMKMMRMQYGMLMGGAKGVVGVAQLAETFLDSLGDKTDVSSGKMSSVLEKLPDGLATATRETLEEAEDIPQQMVDAYRRHSKA